MALKIYSSATPASSFSQDASYDDPFVLAFDGITGGTIEKRLYVRNDDINFVYSGVQVQAIDGGEDIVSNENDGFTWKLSAGDEQPAAANWNIIIAGEAITVPALNDTSTYEPFWLRVEIPSGTPVQSFQLVKLRISSTEVAV